MNNFTTSFIEGFDLNLLGYLLGGFAMSFVFILAIVAMCALPVIIIAFIHRRYYE